MKPTENESAELKHAFKRWFIMFGYNTPLPADLHEAAHDYPLEWREACQEFEKWGLS